MHQLGSAHRMARSTGLGENFNRVHAAPTWLLVLAGLLACTRVFWKAPPDAVELLKLPNTEWLPWWIQAIWHPLLVAMRQTFLLVLPAIAILTWEKLAAWCHHVLFDSEYQGSLDMLLRGQYFRAASDAFSACADAFLMVIAVTFWAVPIGIIALPLAWLPYSLLLYSSAPFTRFAKCDAEAAAAAIRSAEYFGSEISNASLLNHATQFQGANVSLPPSPAWSVVSLFPAPDMFTMDTAIANVVHERLLSPVHVGTADGHIWYTYMQSAVVFGIFMAAWKAKESLRTILSHRTMMQEEVVQLRHSQTQELRSTFAQVIDVGTAALAAIAVYVSVWHIIEQIQLCFIVVTQLPCHHTAFPLMACVNVLLTTSFVVASVQFIVHIASGVHRCRLADGITPSYMEKIAASCECVEFVQLQKMDLCQEQPDLLLTDEQEVCTRIELRDITPWLEAYANECENRLRTIPIDEIVASVGASTSAMRWFFWLCAVSQIVILLLGCVIYIYCTYCIWIMAVTSIPLHWMESHAEWSIYVVAATFHSQFASVLQAAPPAPVTWEVGQQFGDLARSVQHVISCMNDMSTAVAMNMLDGLRAGPPITWREYLAGIFLAGIFSAGTWFLCFLVIALMVAAMSLPIQPLENMPKLSTSRLNDLLSSESSDDGEWRPVHPWLQLCLDIRSMLQDTIPDAVCANLDFVSVGAVLLHLIDNSHPFTDNRYPLTDESFTSKLKELKIGHLDIFPTSSTALLWLLQKRGLCDLRTHESPPEPWEGLTPRMMFTALPTSEIICRADLQRNLPVIPRVLQSARMPEIPLRLHDGHLWHVYGHEEDPTPWTWDVHAWLERREDLLAFCLMPLAAYFRSLDNGGDLDYGGEDGESGESGEDVEAKAEERLDPSMQLRKQPYETVLHDLLRSGLERRQLCGHDDAAMQAYIAEITAFNEHNDNLRELIAQQDDDAARKELKRREACRDHAYALAKSLTNWWKDASWMNARLRLACVTTQMEVAHRDARWHARKAAVHAWAHGSAHSPDDFTEDNNFSVQMTI